MENKKIMTFKKCERGQAATEFAIISPLIFGMFMIMLVAGLTWFGHDMTVQLALEGASKGGIEPGLGQARVSELADFMPGYNITASASDSKYSMSQYFSGDYRQYDTTGITPAWSILGIGAGVGHTSGSAQSPVWEFVP